MNTSVSGPTRTEAAFFLPQHTTETEELKPQLRLLLSHFSIPYDMEELRDASKEIELFSLISNPERVMQVLQDHAAKTVSLASSHPTFVASQGLHQGNYDQIWETIYSNINLYQNENMKEDDLSVERDENDPAQISLSQCANEPVKQKKETGYSYAVALQLLGLDDGTGPIDRDPVLMRGTYLSFLYLRHLRIRELQHICLGILNCFRSVERTLTINTSGLTLIAGSLVPTSEDSFWVNVAKGGVGTSQGLSAHHCAHGTSAEHKVTKRAASQMLTRTGDGPMQVWTDLLCCMTCGLGKQLF
ncbi:uncharacterized protein LOC132530276 [Lagenorhynchus albirostris]|uniref:uncharacterized protein LOC132530276 n=1 Tax=Lagenorhynchus albirostris TaxID=27610 RepID=UPI0028E61D30|nr:uncharacterized protein LOC132530276 [Lagenorhynchus albirostris]